MAIYWLVMGQEVAQSRPRSAPFFPAIGTHIIISLEHARR
jgi:hypothetical protein